MKPLLLAVALIAQAIHAAEFRAGAATSNITPELGSSINGGFQDGKAAFIHDELHARCLALDDGQIHVELDSLAAALDRRRGPCS